MTGVLLKIMGINMTGNDEAEQVELVTEGDLSQKGDEIHLCYDESELSGMEGHKTCLVVDRDSVRMTRMAGGDHVETEIFFQVGTRHAGLYETPYGPIEMEVLTNELISDISGEEGGSINIDYHISLKGLSEGRNKLSIQVDKMQ